MWNLVKMSRFTFMALLMGGVIALSGCGNNGSSKQFPDVFLSGNGFRLVAASPQPRSEYVPITSQLTLEFSEPIDTTSVTGNVKVTKTQSNQITDVTSSFVVSVISIQAV